MKSNDIYVVNEINEPITSTQQMIDLAVKKGWFYLGASTYLYSREGLLKERNEWRDHKLEIIDDVAHAPFWIIDSSMPEEVPTPMKDAEHLHDYLRGSDED